MAKDSDNTKLWDEVKSLEVANKKELLDHVEEVSCCIICQVLICCVLLLCSPLIF